jgi:hypothetical protein
LEPHLLHKRLESLRGKKLQGLQVGSQFEKFQKANALKEINIAIAADMSEFSNWHTLSTKLNLKSGEEILLCKDPH